MAPDSLCLLEQLAGYARFTVGVLLLSCARSVPSSATDPHRQSDFQLSPDRAYSHRGWIGIRVDESPDGTQGVLVTGTVPHSPASTAEIQVGDRLTQAEGHMLTGPEDLVRLIRSREPGTRLAFAGWRGAEPKVFRVSIEPSPDENGVLERTFVNQPAPALDGLVTLSGEIAPSWSSLRGRVVVLDFWAPFCGVCHLVSAELNRWKTRYADQLTVIGIAAGSVAEITKFAPRFQMHYAVVADPNERVVKAFDAFAVPMIVVVDTDGVVRAITLGYSSPRMTKMEKLVEKLITPTAAVPAATTPADPGRGLRSGGHSEISDRKVSPS